MQKIKENLQSIIGKTVKIESFKSNVYPLKPVTGKEVSKQEEPVSKHSDSIEISAKAQELSKTMDNSKNLDAIREKVQSGYYNSDKVLSKVADAILKELQTK